MEGKNSFPVNHKVNITEYVLLLLIYLAHFAQQSDIQYSLETKYYVVIFDV